MKKIFYNIGSKLWCYSENEEEETEEAQFSVKDMLMALSSSFQEERGLPTEVVSLISSEFKLQPQQCEQQSAEPPKMKV
jgi:hypothetical protein